MPNLRQVQLPSTEPMNGILVYQQIRSLIEQGVLRSNPAIAPSQIQPSSLDLRLATRGYRVRSGFLP